VDREHELHISSAAGLCFVTIAAFYRGSADDPLNVAESLIAFQLVGYIRYTLHHVRNLIDFVTVGFVLSLIALHGYPSQAPRTITTFITIFAGESRSRWLRRIATRRSAGSRTQHPEV
jgi:hypothetical protein